MCVFNYNKIPEGQILGTFFVLWLYFNVTGGKIYKVKLFDWLTLTLFIENVFSLDLTTSDKG